MNTRKAYGDNENMILFNEVNGICPISRTPLLYRKKNRIYRVYEIAHIYPLNPKPEEITELAGVQKLYSNDPNELDNVICLCPNCHTRFDKPRTREEYELLMNVKKELIVIGEGRKQWHEFKLEEQVQVLIETLSDDNYDLNTSSDELNYDPKEVKKKLNSSISSLLSRKIERNVSEFYPIVSRIFKEQDYLHPLTTEKVSTQVKMYYLENKDDEDQKAVFKKTVAWIHSKTRYHSLEASEILASYFVQNCELFDV